MPLLLHIETATEICSVALSENGNLLAEKEERSPNSHSATLTVLTEQLFSETALSLQQLDAIAVSAGPGSFTGLRIGASAAKGFSYAFGKPLLAVPTMQAMAAGAAEQVKDKDALYCPVLNSIKQEVYAGLYDFNLREIIPASPVQHTLEEIIPYCSGKKVYVFGTGEKKITTTACSEMKLLSGFSNSAKHLIGLAEQLFAIKQSVSTAYFEPQYVKDFVPRTPEK